MTKTATPADRWDLPGKLTVTVNTTSGPHDTTADAAPIGAYVDIEATARGFQLAKDGSGHMVLKSDNGGICFAVAPQNIVAEFGDLLRTGNKLSLRGHLKAVTPADGSDGSEPSITITHVERPETDADPHEVGWEDGSQEHAEVMAWAADDGRPILYTDAHGKKFLFTVEPYQG